MKVMYEKSISVDGFEIEVTGFRNVKNSYIIESYKPNDDFNEELKALMNKHKISEVKARKLYQFPIKNS